jgi:hypothetical protein
VKSFRLSRAFALVAVLWETSCSPIVDPAPPTDPCAAEPIAVALGDTVRGVLDPATDCFDRDGRLGDAYLLTLSVATLFDLTLTAEGFLPFAPTYRGEDQLSGWASDSLSTLSREHIYPLGGYVLRASSYLRASTPGEAPRGGYSLSTAPLTIPQEGCGRESSVTYGSVAEGRIAADDCGRASSDEPEVERLSDGYAAILSGGRDMTAIATATFPFRLIHLADGASAGASPWLEAGAETTLTATGEGFHDFYILAERPEASGTYLIRFVEGGGASAPPPSGSSAKVWRAEAR